MSYDRQRKSAHTGSTVVVSGVDANVLGLESGVCKRAVTIRCEAAKQRSLTAAAAGEVFRRQHRQRVKPPVAVVVPARRGARSFFWRRRTRRTTSHPSAKPGLCPAATLRRLLRGGDARTAGGPDHHLRE